MVQILCMRKWPQCAKLTDRPALPQPEPVTKLKPEPKPKQSTSIQKLPESELGPKEKPMIVTPDSVLDSAKEASKMPEPVPKRDTGILDVSSLSEDAPEQKAPETNQEQPCKGLDKAYIARIRETLRKRKSMAEIRPTIGKAQLDASSEGQDDWIERELESGIIVGSKPLCNNKKAEQKTEVVLLETSRENDDLWIEKELEEGIIVDSKPVSHNKVTSTGESGARASLELKKYGALNTWRGLRRERETGVNLTSKRQRR